jgi:hypothetical protein
MRSVRTIAGALAGAVLLLAASCPWAWAQTGAINVRIGGGATDGAKVTIKELGGQQSGQTQTTGRNGRADFSGLTPGNYEVTVEVDGKRGNSYVRVGADRPVEAPFDSRGLPQQQSATNSPAALLEAVHQAAIGCSREDYDRAVEELRRAAALAATNVRDLNNMVEEYTRLSGYQPDLQQLRVTLRRAEAAVMTGRRATTGQAREAGAPVDPGLVYIVGYVRALELREQARARQRELDAAVQQIPPFERRCGMSLPDRLKWQIVLSGDIGLVLLDRPQFRQFRTEIAGVIQQLGAFRADHTDTAVRSGASFGTQFDAPMGSDGKAGVELRGWRKDATTKDGVDQIDAPGGGTIGLFSPPTSGNPFGGYSTGNPLTDVSYRGRFRAYGGELQMQTWYYIGLMTLTPFAALRFGHIDLDERISAGIGAPAFTSFEQKNTINDSFFGPSIGLRLNYDFAAGLYAFGGVSFSADFHKATGRWQTIVPLVDSEPRRANLSNSKLGVSVGAEAGVGMRLGALSAQISAGAYYYSASPYLNFPKADSTTTGTGGADIGFARQIEYLGRFGLRVLF